MIVFLDFDGVTHPDPCTKDQYFCQLPIFEKCLRDHQNIEVVISSTWRYENNLSQLKQYFSIDVRNRIIDTTPALSRKSDEDWIPPLLAKHHREWECRKWLLLNRSIEAPWLAIDDSADWFLPGCKNLIQTESTRGFTNWHQDFFNQIMLASTNFGDGHHYFLTMPMCNLIIRSAQSFDEFRFVYTSLRSMIKTHWH